MAEIAELGLKITSDDVVKATKRLDKLEEQSKRTEKAATKNAGAFELFKKALPLVAIGATIKAIIGVADSFQQLNARLLTATGSQEAANIAFNSLRNLAFEMPGGIDQVTDAYIKLTNLGLNPSREALVSYGNTAAAMGKDLNQLIEAVSDAVTLEFERLKEFGIKTRNEGDKIAFTFRGITTRVENSAQSIEEFLIGLGKNEFAGAMEQQNKTLGAAFTDLSDSVALATEKLASTTGFTSAVADATIHLGLLIRQLSGTETIKDFENSIDDIDKQIKSLNEDLRGMETEDRSILSSIFLGDPETIRKSTEERIKALQEQRAAIQEELDKAKIEESKQAATTQAEERDKDLSKDLEKIREATKTELEIIQEKYDQRQAILDEALLTEQISEEEHQDQMNRIQQEYAEKRVKMKEAEKQAMLSIQTGIFDNLASMMSSGSKKQFEAGKVAAIASALLKGKEAVLGAYAAGSKVGGPLLGGLYAASAAVAVGQQINAIKNTEFSGGGGGVSAPGGGAPGTAPVPTPPALEGQPIQQGAGSIINVNIGGSDDDLTTIGTTRKIIERLSEEIKNAGGYIGDIKVAGT